MASTSPYIFASSERPPFAGSPYLPRQTNARRALYALAGLVTGIGSSFANALTTVNVGTMAGNLGLFANEASVLPALFVAANATGNLTLVKSRARFGVAETTSFLLSLYIIAIAAQFIWPGLAFAALTRAISGVCGAALVSMTIYNLLQVFPGELKPLALIVGLGLPQLATPLARLIPVELLADHGWLGLHLVELGCALTLLVTVIGVRLPPSDRINLFEPVDAASIFLFFIAATLLCEVIGLGRLAWWFDTPSLGVMTALGLGALGAAICIELTRAKPLIIFSWLGTTTILRFAAVAFLVRLALAEQTYNAVGLLTSGGLTNDQLHTLFVYVALAMLVGLVIAALTTRAHSMPYQVIVACLAIALGSYLDSQATNLTRPSQLYVSQALLGFGTTLFIGPAIAYGILRVLESGGQVVFNSFVVMFSVTQNVGGLLGSAVLGTIQTISARAHANALAEQLIASDPDVVYRLSAGSGAVASQTPDVAVRAVEGARLLAASLNREANVLAYNDTFLVVVVVALGTASFIALALLMQRIRAPAK